MLPLWKALLARIAWAFRRRRPNDAADGKRHDPVAAMRHDGFRLYLTGSLVSNIGSHMRTTVVSWEIYARTGEALDLGLIGLVMAAPVLLLALPAGAAADRYPRKLLVMLAQFCLMLCGLGLWRASASEAPLAYFYVLLFLTGACRAIGWPPASALVTGLVPAHTFANAAMWRSIVFQLSATTGPLLGAWLLHFLAPAWIYLIDASTSAFMVTLLLFVRPGPQARSIHRRAWHSLAEGGRFVLGQPIILSTITLDMVAVLFGGATALLPLYAVDVLHVGKTGFGWLRAMPSLGAICMALLLAVSPPIQRAGRTLLLVVAAFGVATIVFGLSTSYPLSLAALFVLGAFDNVSVVIRSTLVQLLTPDAMRGRVSAINAIFVNMSNELGEFESGMVAHWLGALTTATMGAVITVAGGGVMTLVTVGAAAIIWPQMRALGSLVELRPAEGTPTNQQDGDGADALASFDAKTAQGAKEASELAAS